MDLEKISMGRRVVLGSGLLLFIISLFTWNNFCASALGVKVCGGGAGAWATGRGKMMGIFLILLLIWEVVLLLQVISPDTLKLPDLPVKPIMISLALGAITILFGVLRVFQGGGKQWAAWVGLLLLIALAAGLFLRFQEEGGAAAVK
jgi:hypothetical protein